MAATGNQSPSPNDAAARPSSLACLECRRKHLRCDAAYPTCRRCGAARLACNYAPSRRGRKRLREDPEISRDIRWPSMEITERTASSAADSHAESAVQTTPTDRVSSAWTGGRYSASDMASHCDLDVLGPLPPGFDSIYGADAPAEATAAAVAAVAATTIHTDEPSDWSDWVDDEALVNLYYFYFHRPHPFLVPRHLYHLRKYPRHLRLAVQFVGSHYSSTISSDTLRAATGRALADRSQRTATMVQALLMFAVSLHARHELCESEAALSRAVQLALELGMHQRGYATAHGAQLAVEEESLRRTWWELFVVDGYLAALHHKTSFRSGSVCADVLLPCEESAYADGAVILLEPLSLAQFDAEVFSEQGLPFSSFSYRIDAVRILARVIAIARTYEAHRDEVEAVDSALAGWGHHLHRSKSEMIGDVDELDEMLFQAHMIVQYASMLLHCPRSDLISGLPAAAEISCGQSDAHVFPTATQHTHAAKAVDASRQLASLAALRAPVRRHTPFFICALLLAATVQLSSCASSGRRPSPQHHHHRPIQQHRQHLDRVGLIIGVLKSLSQTWALAKNALRLIRKVACEVLEQQNSENSVLGLPARTGPAGGSTSEMDDARAGEVSLPEGLQDLIHPDQWVLPVTLQLGGGSGLAEAVSQSTNDP